MSDPVTLDGRTAIVTGAGHGLGRAEAIALARAGRARRGRRDHRGRWAGGGPRR